MIRPARGFTLIELLMVIAIIAIMSTIVIGAVQNARYRAMDAAVRTQMAELRTIMQQEWSTSGTYTAIKSGGSWKGENGSCNVSNFNGQFASRAAEVCTKLVRTTGTGCGSSCVYFQTVLSGGADSPTRYTIQAFLPGATREAGSLRYLCMGSSGNQSVSAGPSWEEDGCYRNP